MTVLVGYPLTRRAREVLDLAAMFARSRSEDLVVCSVIAHPLMTENKRASQEIYDEAQRVATNAFERAHRDMPDDVHVEYRAVASRSILRGILDTAKEVGASLIVAGADTSPVGKITLSTVADRLLHGSSVPVAVASRGLLTPKKRISRVTLAFTGSKNSHAQVAAAQEFADSFEVPLRLATFAINLPFPPGATSPARESGVRRAWEDKMHTLAHDATPAGYDAPEFVIGRGP
jgi:nucleotide-binding universal stress UspA family protein